MQRQRVLLMEGKLTKCPKELRNHPIYTLNEAKNNYIVKRRGKVITLFVANEAIIKKGWI